MPQTIDSASSSVALAKSQFEHVNHRLLHLLTFVPDDKLTWTPSATANSALQIVAHAAKSSRVFAKLITGTMDDPMPAPPDFLASLMPKADDYPTRESVIQLVHETADELRAAYETINSENIDAPVNSPFGPIPTRFWMGLGHNHMAGHVGQLEYLQTIWGDRDNHM